LRKAVHGQTRLCKAAQSEPRPREVVQGRARGKVAQGRARGKVAQGCARLCTVRQGCAK
jgi:hypothetical protein